MININLKEFGDFFRQRGILMILHIIILLISILLIALISYDTFEGINFYDQARFEKWQFWICVVFIADFFIELFLSDRKWHYFATHFIFLLVSIPYQAIIYQFGWVVSLQFSYIIRYMPLIRAGYAMAIVVGWFTSNKVTGLFFSYIITLISTVYFASLIFFLFEQGINPEVKQYQDALWWATMDVTTVGCNIIAVTPVGRILSVLLAALGMMMFPIFTVYVTNMIQKRNAEAEYNASFVSAYKRFVKNHPEDESGAEEAVDKASIVKIDSSANPKSDLPVSNTAPKGSVSTSQSDKPTVNKGNI